MEVALSIEVLLLALALAWGATAFERAVQAWERTRVLEATTRATSELGGKLVEKLVPNDLFRRATAAPPVQPNRPADDRR